MPESNKSAKKGHVSKPLLVAIIATVLLILFIVFALLIAPTDELPVFELTDQNGDWDAQSQGRIAIFGDELIKPDSHGEYKFVITNPNESTLMYGFKLSEYLGNLNVDAEPFMQYRIKFDNKYIDDDWHYVGLDYTDIEILPGSQHILTLEWHWPFYTDGEHDENDTRIGNAAGKLSVHIFVWAEIVPEEIW